MAFPRCNACTRLILPRWRRCPWCKRWTGQPHFLDADALEAELHSLAIVGGLTAVGLGFFAATMWDAPLLFWLTGGVGAALALSSLLLLGSGLALDAALALNLAFCAAAVWGGTYGAGIAGLVAGLGVLRRKKLRALLAGSDAARGWTPPADISRCVHCGAPAAGVLGPRLVVSAIYMAAMTYFPPRPRCLTHARMAALPATLITLCFGWWSPWGLFWTPDALYDNVVFGGVETAEGTADAERIARIGYFRVLLPLFAAVAGAANWYVAGTVLMRLLE